MVIISWPRKPRDAALRVAAIESDESRRMETGAEAHGLSS